MTQLPGRPVPANSRGPADRPELPPDIGGGAPFITNLTWKSWGSKSAWGTGKIWTQKAGCSPSYKCKFSSRWVGISLTTIKKHGARPYYDRMAVEMRVGTRMHWFVGWFKYYPGATVPSWIFPLVWPYL
jgi:hypothetical protein